MTDRKCLVVGGCGFIGTNLVLALADRGASVRVFDRSDASIRAFQNHATKVEFVSGDLMDPETVRSAVQGITHIIHVAGSSLPNESNQDPRMDLQDSLGGGLTLLEAAVDEGVEQVVFTSSGGTVYGRMGEAPLREADPTAPISAYGITKLAMEKYLHLYKHLHDLNYCVLRLANPYGQHQNPMSAQGAVAVFLEHVRRRDPITIWGDGSVVRDYIHINDVVRAYLSVIDSGVESAIYNVGTGRGTTLSGLLDTIRKVTGASVEVRYEAGRHADLPANVLDVSRISDEQNWQPAISLEEGLTQTWNWLKHQVGQE